MVGAILTFKEADPSSKFEISMGPKARCSGTRNWQLWLLSPMFFWGIYRDIQPTNIGFIHSWTPQQSPQLESRSTCRSDRRGKLSPPQQFRSEEIWQRVAGKISKGRNCSPFNSSYQNKNLPKIEIQHDSPIQRNVLCNCVTCPPVHQPPSSEGPGHFNAFGQVGRFIGLRLHTERGVLAVVQT